MGEAKRCPDCGAGFDEPWNMTLHRDGCPQAPRTTPPPPAAPAARAEGEDGKARVWPDVTVEDGLRHVAAHPHTYRGHREFLVKAADALAAAESAREAAERERDDAQADAGDWSLREMAARHRADRLEATLRKMGHQFGCTANAGLECTCGLAAALAPAPGEAETGEVDRG